MKSIGLAAFFAMLTLGGCSSVGTKLTDTNSGLKKDSWSVTIRLENQGRIVHEFSKTAMEGIPFKMHLDQYIRIPVSMNWRKKDEESPDYIYRIYPKGPVITGQIARVRDPIKNSMIGLISSPELSSLFHADCNNRCLDVLGHVKWSIGGQREYEAIRLTIRESHFDFHCHLGEWQSIEIGGANEPWQILKIKFDQVGGHSPQVTHSN